jgi:hypothetical protein
MNNSSLRKTAVAAAVAGMLAAGGAAQADVVNFSWRGAFTLLNPTGDAVFNSPTDYQFGYYANGDNNPPYGAPYFPNNVGPNADCVSQAPACITAYGWYGRRTPVSGTISFDISNRAGVGTINPFFFFGDAAGSGPGTQVATFLNPTFQFVDTVGTIVGTMLMSWNGGGHSLSIVLDGSGLLGNLEAMIAGGNTSSLSGVGALPATENTNFGPIKSPVYLPLGPSPIATKTLNALGCEAQLLATQVNAYTINPTGNIANCDLNNDDGIGGSPAISAATEDFNYNFDIMSLHLESPPVCENGICPPPVPVPPALWLFGSGLLGLIGLARRKKNT